MNVCEFHGGKVPISIRAARSRLVGLVPRALEALEKAMEYGDWPVVVRAAQIILDRAGLGAQATISIEEREKDLSSLTPQQLEDRAKRVYAALREMQNAAHNQTQHELEHANTPLIAGLNSGLNDEGLVS